LNSCRATSALDLISLNDEHERFLPFVLLDLLPGPLHIFCTADFDGRVS